MVNVAITIVAYDGDTLKRSTGQGMGGSLQSRAASRTNLQIGSECAIRQFYSTIGMPPAIFCITVTCTFVIPYLLNVFRPVGGNLTGGYNLMA